MLETSGWAITYTVSTLLSENVRLHPTIGLTDEVERLKVRVVVKEYQELTPLSRIFACISHTGVPYFQMGR